MKKARCKSGLVVVGDYVKYREEIYRVAEIFKGSKWHKYKTCLTLIPASLFTNKKEVQEYASEVTKHKI